MGWLMLRLLPKLAAAYGRLENGSISSSSSSQLALSWNLVATWCFTRPNKGRHCLIIELDLAELVELADETVLDLEQGNQIR